MRAHGPSPTTLFLGAVVVLAGASSWAAEFYVAPQSRGSGSGLAREDAAMWTAPALWDAAHSAVASEDTTVWFLDGNYSTPSLILSRRGNPDHWLTLQGESPTGAILDAEVGTMMSLAGCTHIRLRHLHWRGDGFGYGLTITKTGSTVSEYVEVDSCSWIDMHKIYYGAMGSHHGSHHVTVRNCVFRRVGVGGTAHFIYNAYEPHHLLVENNLFEDCAGHYVRFRDGSDYCTAWNNTFRCTGGYGPEVESDTHFITVPLFADADPGDEWFGTNFTITSNTYSFYTGASGSRTAFGFIHRGYDPPGLHYLLTPAEGAIVESGSPFAQADLLVRNCNIDASKILIANNSYIACDRMAIYDSAAAYGATSKGWSGWGDIYAAIARRERFRDDFESGTGSPAGWTVHEVPGQTTVTLTTDNPATGSQCLYLRDESPAANCYILREALGTRAGYFAARYRFDETDATHVCLYNDGYWLMARNDGQWSNGDGAFSGPAYTANQWYLAEIVYDYYDGTYTVWIDGGRIAHNVPLPNANGAMTGNIQMNACYVPQSGGMAVDQVVLADLTEPRYETEPTPTPTPSATPTSTASPTPTATPSATPSPTPSPTPSRSPTPTATPTSRPMPAGATGAWSLY